MTPDPVSPQAAAPPTAPNIKIKPQEERAPVVFSPVIRRVAHILYAAKGPVPVSVIEEGAALEAAKVASVISCVRTAVGSTGASVTVEHVDGERAYRLTVPNRHAFERLVGAPPDGIAAETVAFHGFVGQKALVLRTLAEANGAYLSVGELMRTVYGRETARARERITALIRVMRAALVAREEPGTILSRGNGLDLAYAWAQERGADAASDAGPVKRIDGVTLPAIGCAAWRFYPSLGSRHSAHVVRLRGEDRDRVLTDAEQAVRPELSALAAPHGVWPPAREEEREAA